MSRRSPKTELLPQQGRGGLLQRLAGGSSPIALTLPATVGMLIFFVAPLVTFAVYSFLIAGLFSVSGPATLANYHDAIHSPINRTLAPDSVIIGRLAAAVSVAVGLPIAYWLRYAAGRMRTLVLFLIT